MTPAGTIGFVVSVGCATAAVSFACGDLGEPAFVGSDGAAPPVEVTSPFAFDASEEEAAPNLVSLAGRVRDPDTDAALPFALVAIEMGGLDQTNPAAASPDGAVTPTLVINPLYRYGAMTDDGGAFSLEVPDEPVGVHVYKSGFFCGVPDVGAVTPGDASLLVRPDPLRLMDGGSEIAKPTIEGFTVTPSIAAPGEIVTMSARVEAADPATDPLSDQVVAVEPISSWAGVFAPPEPGTPDAGYPNGIYARLVPAPLVPGEYTFYLVAATRSCVVSEFATQTVLVTPTGEAGDEAGD